MVDLSLDEALTLLREALERCVEAIGFPKLTLREADQLFIDYVGPLGGARDIKLDLADNELVLESTRRAVIARYPDQTEERATLPTYTIEEIAAEKLRCVIQRLVCRDISDLHRLFVREGVDVDAVWPLFAARFPERLSARERQYRQRWEELFDLEPDVAPFDQVIRELRRQLRDYL